MHILFITHTHAPTQTDTHPQHQHTHKTDTRNTKTHTPCPPWFARCVLCGLPWWRSVSRWPGCRRCRSTQFGTAHEQRNAVTSSSCAVSFCNISFWNCIQDPSIWHKKCPKEHILWTICRCSSRSFCGLSPDSHHAVWQSSQAKTQAAWKHRQNVNICSCSFSLVILPNITSL